MKKRSFVPTTKRPIVLWELTDKGMFAHYIDGKILPSEHDLDSLSVLMRKGLVVEVKP